MSKRADKPPKHANPRTIKRWLDPANRTIIDIYTNKIIPSANPNCTRERNPERFAKRKELLK